MLWGPVLHYEGLYEVNVLGQVRDMRTGKIITVPTMHDRSGVHGSRTQSGKVRCTRRMANGKHRGFYPHIEVARNFVPNPDSKPTVDHIDGDYTNNEWWNLRWATHSEQVHYVRAKR